MNDVTHILSAVEHGDPHAAEQLLPLVYAELRQLAAQKLALDEALTRLAHEDPRAAEVVKLRFFAGLSVEEAGRALGISRAHAYRHWTYARAWLRCAVRGEDDASPG